jgi:hypothetical protein
MQEEMYLEFPPSDEKQIHFRLYLTNAANRTETTNDFVETVRMAR